MRDGGKGDRQRPLGIPEEKFASNWDQIFKKKKDNDELSNGTSERCPNHDNSISDNDRGDV